jgi:predicted DNA-binding protein
MYKKDDEWRTTLRLPEELYQRLFAHTQAEKLKRGPRAGVSMNTIIVEMLEKQLPTNPMQKTSDTANQN